MLAIACLGIGWRLVSSAWADLHAEADPAAALRHLPAHPDALANLADAQLAAGDAGAALETARRLLRVEPVDGRGYAAAAIATARMGGADAFRLHEIAARRAPRDLRVRAWLVDTLLRERRDAEALAHLEAILRVSPRQADVLLPRLARLASDPAFADALATTLASSPRWRPAMMQAFLSVVDTPGSARALAALEHLGALSAGERRQWVAALLARDRWGIAYAVHSQPATGREDAVVQPYVAGLEGPGPAAADTEPGVPPADAEAGFGWRSADTTGVRLRVAERGDTDAAPALQLSFPGRPTGPVVLRHRLLLPPGRYRLGVRMRTLALRDGGRLAWLVSCGEGGRILAAIETFPATRDWHEANIQLEVPATGCARQSLQLVHEDPSGLRPVSGELWMSAVTLTGSPAGSVQHGPPAVGATLVVERGRILLGGTGGYAPASADTLLSVGQQLVLTTTAVARLSEGRPCTRRVHGPGTFRIGAGCRMTRIEPAPEWDAGVTEAAADRRGFANAIVGAIDPRDPIPAGR